MIDGPYPTSPEHVTSDEVAFAPIDLAQAEQPVFESAAEEVAYLRSQLGQSQHELRETRKQLGIMGHALVRLQQEQQSERIASSSVEKILERLANTDMLTGLANRRAFDDQFASFVYSASGRRDSDEKPGALVMLDIDKFKEVNDTAGHTAGDNLLIDVADKLRSALRSEDMIARMGGDEFAVVIKTASREECAEIVERLLKIGEDTEPIGAGAVRPTLSIGVAFIEHGDSDKILREADAALYKAKNAGRNRIEFAE